MGWGGIGGISEISGVSLQQRTCHEQLAYLTTEKKAYRRSSVKDCLLITSH